MYSLKNIYFPCCNSYQLYHTLRSTQLGKLQTYLFTDWLGFFSELNIQKQLPEVFHKKGILKNLEKFTGKHVYGSLFSNKAVGLRLQRGP